MPMTGLSNCPSGLRVTHVIFQSKVAANACPASRVARKHTHELDDERAILLYRVMTLSLYVQCACDLAVEGD